MLLEIKNLNYKYSEKSKFNLNIKSVLYDFINPLAIYGLSGSGKTTLGKILAGLIDVPEKSVIFNSENLNILYSAQMSENIFLGTTIKQMLDFISSNNSLVTNLDLKVDSNLQKFDMTLGGIYEKHGHELSVGELRKFSLSLALSCAPDILIFDEPTIGLDMNSKLQLENVLIQYSGKLIVISHDYELLRIICSNLWCIKLGKLVFQGDFCELEENDKLCQELGIDFLKELINRRKEVYCELKINQNS